MGTAPGPGREVVVVQLMAVAGRTAIDCNQVYNLEKKIVMCFHLTILCVIFFFIFFIFYFFFVCFVFVLMQPSFLNSYDHFENLTYANNQLTFMSGRFDLRIGTSCLD